MNVQNIYSVPIGITLRQFNQYLSVLFCLDLAVLLVFTFLGALFGSINYSKPEVIVELDCHT